MGGEADAEILVWNEVQDGKYIYSMRRQWDSFGCPELGERGKFKGQREKVHSSKDAG